MCVCVYVCVCVCLTVFAFPKASRTGLRPMMRLSTRAVGEREIATPVLLGLARRVPMSRRGSDGDASKLTRWARKSFVASVLPAPDSPLMSTHCEHRPATR